MIHAEFWILSTDGQVKEWAGELYAAGASVRIEGEWLEEESEYAWRDPETPAGQPARWLTANDGERWARKLIADHADSARRIRVVVLADSLDPALRDRIDEFAVCYRYALPDAQALELDVPSTEPRTALSEER